MHNLSVVCDMIRSIENPKYQLDGHGLLLRSRLKLISVIYDVYNIPISSNKNFILLFNASYV